MRGEERIRISKLEAAKRQIDTAIHLYFSEEDETSIHTLGAAALQVLLDLRAQRGLPENLLRDSFLEQFRPDARKDAAKKFAEAANFLKHADRDPDAILEFAPIVSEYILSDAVAAYRVLGGLHSREMAAYWIWTWLTLLRPGIIDGEFAKNLEIFETKLPKPVTRQSFFAYWQYAPDRPET